MIEIFQDTRVVGHEMEAGKDVIEKSEIARELTFGTIDILMAFGAGAANAIIKLKLYVLLK